MDCWREALVYKLALNRYNQKVEKVIFHSWKMFSIARQHKKMLEHRVCAHLRKAKNK